MALEARIAAAIKKAHLLQKDVGYVLMGSDGAPLAAQNEDELFVVASNDKIVTTSSALALLGADFTWTTTLLTKGALSGDTLEGDLLVKGTGDPNISGRDHDADALFLFRLWAEALRAKGIRRVTGSIVLDDSAFDRTYVHPTWSERFKSAWFGAEISALSFADNCVLVQLEAPKNAGTPVRVIVYPPTSYVDVIGHCVATRGKGVWGIKRHPDKNIVYVTGNLKAGSSPDAVWIPVHEPALYFGTVLRETLAAEGITVGAPKLATAPLQPGPDVSTIHTFTSRLLDSIVITNKRSQNFYAEQILKTIGQKRSGVGSFESGIAAVEEHLRSLGIARGQYHYTDGSGLSSDNRFTPRQLATILRAASASSWAEAFKDSLPTSGVDGTLEHRMTEEALRERVHAKTGFLQGVSTLSGYLDLGDSSYPFSILVNAENASKQQMDDLEAAILRIVVRELP